MKISAIIVLSIVIVVIVIICVWNNQRNRTYTDINTVKELFPSVTSVINTEYRISKPSFADDHRYTNTTFDGYAQISSTDIRYLLSSYVWDEDVDMVVDIRSACISKKPLKWHVRLYDTGDVVAKDYSGVVAIEATNCILYFKVSATPQKPK